MVSRLFIWNESEALVVVQTMALFYSTFPSYEGLSDIAACCEIFVVCSDSEAFFQSNYNISSYFPHHQHQNGKKSFTDGLQRSVLGMVAASHLHSSRRSRKVEVEKKCAPQVHTSRHLKHRAAMFIMDGYNSWHYNALDLVCATFLYTLLYNI